MSTDTNNLPDLPEPDHLLDGGTVPFFTAEQMRAYAQATADAWAQKRDAHPPSQPPREPLTLSDEQLDRVRGKLGAAASMLSGKTLREIARAVLAAQEQKT